MKSRSRMPLVVIRLAALAILAAATSVASAQTGATTSPTLYRLGPGSTYQYGCFAPCLCPILAEVPLRGTFGLAVAGFDGLFSTYRVTDVNWTASLPEGERRITGSGTYMIGGEFALQQRLELNLKVGEGAAEHFDSRLITGASVRFPSIDLRVSIRGEYCLDTVMEVNGTPASPQLAVTLNQTTFHPGDTIEVEVAVQNLGSAFSADFYAGILSPDGSIQFFTSAGIVGGRLAELTSFRPIAAGVPLAMPFSVTAPNFYTHQWTVSDLRGAWVFFLLAVNAGALAGGSVTSDEILGLATAPFSLL